MGGRVRESVGKKDREHAAQHSTHTRAARPQNTLTPYTAHTHFAEEVLLRRSLFDAGSERDRLNRAEEEGHQASGDVLHDLPPEGGRGVRDAASPAAGRGGGVGCRHSVGGKLWRGEQC